MLQRIVLIQESDVENAGKVLPQIMRSAGLQRPAVTHEPFDSIGAQSSGKLLPLRFATGDHRNSHFSL